MDKRIFILLMFSIYYAEGFKLGFKPTYCFNFTYSPCVQQVCIYGKVENRTRCNTLCLNGKWVPSTKPYAPYPQCCPTCRSKIGLDVIPKTIYKVHIYNRTYHIKNHSIPYNYQIVKKQPAIGFTIQQDPILLHPVKYKPISTKTIMYVKSDATIKFENTIILPTLAYVLYRLIL